MDPIATPLLIVVLGNLARELITDACKDHLKGKLKSLFAWLEKLGERDKVELAYQDAMEQAYGACLEMLLLNIKGFGYSDDELRQYQSSIEAFVKDDVVAQQLLDSIREPGRNDLPSPDVLRRRWKEVAAQELPDDTIWNAVAFAFRRQATKRIILSDDLRELLNAQTLQQLKGLIERQGGVKVQVRRDKYSQRMRTKFSPVDLANLMPAYADDPGRMVIRDVFVAQNVRENPPPVEIPKDLAERLKKRRHHEARVDTDEDLDEQQLEKLRTAYVSQLPKPVLDVIAATGNRLLVLTGEPGSGKSTLMRYLLTGIIEPPVDRESGKPLCWTLAFKGAFPLLIELRDFYALRHSGECDSFLEYVAFMGKTDQWFLDDHAVHGYLDSGPSLVMFDGVDEIFDTGDRKRVMQEIAGFAQRYAHARIVVTSRPVGYKEQVLRDAGFAHFGIQDLDDGQIQTFTHGWFALTFPQQPQQAEQRIERVLGSVRQSKPIRLLAGNPMLLTIMALLARQQELPRQRARFYEQAVEVLCHHWDANRNLDLSQDRYLNADDKKDLLRRIAMRMQGGKAGLKGNIIQEDDLEQEIQGYLFEEQLKANLAGAKQAARGLIRQLRERNYILCLRGPHLYGFVHRTFLEYLTAAEYVRRFDKQPQQMTIDELVNLFDQHCRDDDWREVLRLICGQIDERFVGQIIERLATRTDLRKWDGRTPLPELALAAACLSEARTLERLQGPATLLLEQVTRLFTATVHPKQGWGSIGGIPTDPLGRFLEQDVLGFAKDIGPRWAGTTTVPQIRDWAVDATNSYVSVLWLIFLIEVNPEVDRIRDVAKGHVDETMRRVAFTALAKKHPYEATRALLVELAVEDKNDINRFMALMTLVDRWADKTTRMLVTKCAVQDKNEHRRVAAIEALADKWADDKATRELLKERAVEDKHDRVRGTAVKALAGKWHDDIMWQFLAERARRDESGNPRIAVLEAVVENYPEEITRPLLEERAVKDEFPTPRSAALRAIAYKWPDDETRKLLEERAVQDEWYMPRSAALEALADKWPDDQTRRFLEKRAVHDAHPRTRGAALVALAKISRDDNTRHLLEQRAVKDEEEYPRGVALQTLAAKWPSEATQNLLKKCARAGGVAASVFAAQHSEFGRIVFTRDLNGREPYLYPAKPMSPGHIEQAATKAGVPPDKIDETVRSLSAHMGWDITKGSAE